MSPFSYSQIRFLEMGKQKNPDHCHNCSTPVLHIATEDLLTIVHDIQG